MTYRGHIKNGQIMLDEPTPLPEGSEVFIEIRNAVVAGDSGTLWNKLQGIAGTVDGPEDWAENHDHYIHGTPKRAMKRFADTFYFLALLNPKDRAHWSGDGAEFGSEWDCDDRVGFNGIG